MISNGFGLYLVRASLGILVAPRPVSACLEFGFYGGMQSESLGTSSGTGMTALVDGEFINLSRRRRERADVQDRHERLHRYWELWIYSSPWTRISDWQQAWATDEQLRKGVLAWWGIDIRAECCTSHDFSGRSLSCSPAREWGK